MASAKSRKKKQQRLVKNIIVYLIMAVILLGVLMFSLSPEQSRPLFGYWFVEVYADNMGDAVPRNSMAMAKEVSLSELTVGDVVAYPYAGVSDYIVVSRITAIDDSAGAPVFTTQGDNMEVADPSVSGAYIMGRVERYMGGMGIVWAYVKANRWIIFGVVVVIEGVITAMRMKKEAERKARARKRAAAKRRAAAEAEAASGQ